MRFREFWSFSFLSKSDRAAEVPSLFMGAIQQSLSRFSCPLAELIPLASAINVPKCMEVVPGVLELFEECTFFSIVAIFHDFWHSSTFLDSNVQDIPVG